MTQWNRTAAWRLPMHACMNELTNQRCTSPATLAGSTIPPCAHHAATAPDCGGGREWRSAARPCRTVQGGRAGGEGGQHTTSMVGRNLLSRERSKKGAKRQHNPSHTRSDPIRSDQMG